MPEECEYHPSIILVDGECPVCAAAFEVAMAEPPCPAGGHRRGYSGLWCSVCH